VDAGWNIIGPSADPVSVAGITSTPAGIVETNFFGFEGGGAGYASVQTLQPSFGYWVKVSQAGTLTLPAAAGSSRASWGAGTARRQTDSGHRLALTDATGRRALLRLQPEVTDGERRKNQLPPKPPRSVPDVRFSHGSHVASLPASNRQAASYQIDVQGLDFPLTARIDPPSPTAAEWEWVIEDAAGAAPIRLDATTPQGRLVRTTSTIRLSVRRVPTPSNYRLWASAPNPLRDRGTVRFSLPRPEEIRIEVFDLLGRRVLGLAEGEWPAGAHTVPVDAGTLSSGLYFVRMQAGDFRETRRLTIVQ
jgi:hypothetical protein